MPPPPHRVPWPIVAFNAAYMLPSVVAAVVTGNGEFVFYIVVMLILFAAVWLVHRRVGLRRATLWMLSLWGAGHMAGGLVPLPASWPVDGPPDVLYNLWFVPGVLRYDHVIHAYGFGTTCWVCWQGLKALVPDLRPGVGPLLLAATAALGFGALNEVVEFAATLMMYETNVGDFNNVGWDLVSNAAGAVAAAMLIALLDRPTVAGDARE